MYSEKWINRYLELARFIAGWSKDSTKIGAIIVGENGQILSQGYNGFPRGVRDDIERYENKELKYKLVVHAELNAILNASLNGVSLKYSTLFIYGLPPCCECAKAIAQSGISNVYWSSSKSDALWNNSYEYSKMIFNEANIGISEVGCE